MTNLLLDDDVGTIIASAAIDCKNWQDLFEIRKTANYNNCCGLRIRTLTSQYRTEIKTFDSILWKLAPFSIKVVLISAQKGKNSLLQNLYDYTFGVWKGDSLQSITTTSCTLSDSDRKFVANFIAGNTKERFGPVRTVNPILVFELSFEGIAESSRHKSGLVLRHTSIVRLCMELSPSQASRLEDISSLISNRVSF